jgi:hypothetical protein
MERFIFSCAAACLMVLGVCLVIWPAWIALLNRDAGETQPPTAGEVWQLRLVGAALTALSGYALYALLTQMPGAEFFPA